MSVFGNEPTRDDGYTLTNVRRAPGFWDLLPATTMIATMFLAPSGALAAELSDGTLVPVRSLNAITTEDAHDGDPLEFVVIRDVVVGDAVVIARGTLVLGEVVEAQRARWGDFKRHGA